MPGIILLRGIWAVLLISILLGFTLQSWEVSKDYFQYRTSTFVAIEGYPEEKVTAPGAVICFRLKGTLSADLKVRELFNGHQNYFNDKDDTWQARVVFASLPTPKTAEDARYLIRKFTLGRRYCLFVQILDQFNMEDVTSSRQKSLDRFYYVQVTTNPAHSPYILGYVTADKECVPKLGYFSLVKDESTLTNPRRPEILKETCTKNVTSHDFFFTYSSFVNVRLPPPYDTNCQEYWQNSQLLSSHHCIDECLKEEGKRWNVIPGATLIDRARYNNSNAYIAFGDIIENDSLTSNVLNNQSIPRIVREAYRTLNREWKAIKISCRRLCFRPDCLSEDIAPQLFHDEVYIERSMNLSSSHANLTYFYIYIQTSHQPIVQASSIPRYRLIDYITYMASHLSFWLGFCPLALADTAVKKLRRNITRRQRREKERTRQRRLVCNR